MDEELNQLAEAIAKILVDRHQTLAISESAAGGLISAAMLGVAGASAYFKGGAVVYTGDGIQRLVGMTAEQLAQHRSSTAPRVEMIALAIREKLGADWGIAESGAAGPTGNRYGDAAGHAAIAVAGAVNRSEVIETAQGDRRRNMVAFAAAALRLLQKALDESGGSARPS
jgi:nicotinamide-nucleotide amidase